jgi:hypothetical protein
MQKQLFTILALFLSSILHAQLGIGTTTPSQALDVETNSATKTAVDINNTSTGDAILQLQINGESKFAVGVDNSDGDKFKISTDTTFGSAPAITVDNSQNVGVGIASPANGLDINTSMSLKTNTITSATTLNNTHNIIFCNNGPYMVTLPTASANTGRVYTIKNIDAEGDDITVDGNDSETIDGQLTYILSLFNQSITIISDGSNWHIIEYVTD